MFVFGATVQRVFPVQPPEKYDFEAQKCSFGVDDFPFQSADFQVNHATVIFRGDQMVSQEHL